MFKHKKRYKIDYHRKNLKNNPYFERVKPAKLHLKDKIYLFIIAMSILIFVYLVFFSSFFQVKKIEIIGNQDIAQGTIEKVIEQEMDDVRYYIFPKSNIFVVSEKDILGTLNRKFFLENAEINKELPNTIKINIKEKISKMILSIKYTDKIEPPARSTSTDVIVMEYMKSYLLDNEGMATALLDEGEVLTDLSKKYPHIVDSNSRNIKIGSQALGKQDLEQLFSLYKKIEDKTSMKINSLNINTLTFTVTGEVNVRENRGYDVIFEVNNNIDQQIQNLSLLLNNTLKHKLDTLDYIDLRFGERVYYK